MRLSYDDSTLALIESKQWERVPSQEADAVCAKANGRLDLLGVEGHPLAADPWVNSIAGLIGYFTKVRTIPSLGFILAAAAIIGGLIGSHLGSRRLAVRAISLCLATELLIAGAKLIFTS